MKHLLPVFVIAYLLTSPSIEVFSELVKSLNINIAQYSTFSKNIHTPAAGEKLVMPDWQYQMLALVRKHHLKNYDVAGSILKVCSHDTIENNRQCANVNISLWPAHLVSGAPNVFLFKTDALPNNRMKIIEITKDVTLASRN